MPLIRVISISDAVAVANLSEQLGYPMSADAMVNRIQTMSTLAEHIVYVACLSERVVGWVGVGIVQHLQLEPYGEITGLIVSNEERGSGIGKALLLQAEAWVTRQGISTMLVRSRTAREAAHRFYLREGYSQTKLSAVFTKQLTQ